MRLRRLGITGSLILTCWMLLSQGWAVDVPVFAKAVTSNQCGWYPDRIGRTLDWDEKYLLSLGIDSLRVTPFGLDLEIGVNEQLDGYRPVIETFLLSWEKESHRLELGTRKTGLGKGYRFAERFVSYPAYDSHLFENDRFNSVSYIWKQRSLSAGAALGGNQLSRGMAIANLAYKAFGQEIEADLRATVSDSHWRSPSLIANLRLMIDLGDFSQRVDMMLKEVPAYNHRPKRQEHAFATEIVYRFTSSTDIAVGGLYEERESVPRSRSELHTSIQQSIGVFQVSPGFSSVIVDQGGESSYNLLINWKPVPQSDIGLVYKFQKGPYDEIRHLFAVQTALRFDF